MWLVVRFTSIELCVVYVKTHIWFNVMYKYRSKARWELNKYGEFCVDACYYEYYDARGSLVAVEYFDKSFSCFPSDIKIPQNKPISADENNLHCAFLARPIILFFKIYNNIFFFSFLVQAVCALLSVCYFWVFFFHFLGKWKETHFVFLRKAAEISVNTWQQEKEQSVRSNTCLTSS